MRISSTLFFQTGLKAINAQQSDLMHLFQQVGSGKRMVTPADDPLAAAQTINISQAQAMNLRYADNREVAKRTLGAEENALTSVTTLIQDIKTRLIEAGNGTLSDADRLTLANVLEHARDTLLGLANATDGNGQYLFSGSRGDVMPFAEGSDYAYQGDAGQREIQVDQTRRLAGSDVGSDIFARATPGVYRYLTAAGASFMGPDNNQGSGTIGNAVVYDQQQLPANRDYQYELNFVSDTEYTITIKRGADIIDPADHPEVDDWTGTQHIEPGKDALVKLPFGVQVTLSGHPQTGDMFSVTPAAHDDLNIFRSLDAVIDALGASFEANPTADTHFQNVLASALQRLDINYDNVLTVRASVGARLNEIDALHAKGELQNLSYRSQLSQLEDLDYYTATTQLELRKSALEAAALAFRKIQGTSLFNIGAGN